MATPSQTDLIAAALTEIGALGAGATPSASDTALVKARAERLAEDLVARRVVAALDTAAVPTAWFPDLVRILAEHIAPPFGRPTSADVVRAAEARLRELSRLSATDPFTLAVLEQMKIYQDDKIAIDAAMIERRIPEILAELSARGSIDLTYEAADLAQEVRQDVIRYVAASLCSPTLFDIMVLSEHRLRAARIPIEDDDAPIWFRCF